MLRIGWTPDQWDVPDEARGAGCDRRRIWPGAQRWDGGRLLRRVAAPPPARQAHSGHERASRVTRPRRRSGGPAAAREAARSQHSAESASPAASATRRINARWH